MKATQLSWIHAQSVHPLSASPQTDGVSAARFVPVFRFFSHDSNWRSVVSKRLIAALLFAVLAISPAAFAQSVTGQISGTVTDASGAVVAGAAVKLTHDLSQQTRHFTTDGNGSFSFFGIVPGAYTLNITQPGFRAYDQKGIVVSAQ